MKTIVCCIRCEDRYYNGHRLTQSQKRAVEDLTLIGLDNWELKNDVCPYCRQGIGNEVSDEMLKIYNHGN